MRDNKEAVALKYASNQNAPVVIAKSSGYSTKRLLEIASKFNVEVVEDEWLPKVLMKTNLNEEIPVFLYEAVAQILSRVYVSKQNAK